MNPYGFIWIHMIQMDPYGSKWIHMDPYGSIWIHIDPHESIWIYMDPYRSKWIHMDSSTVLWKRNFSHLPFKILKDFSQNMLGQFLSYDKILYDSKSLHLKVHHIEFSNLWSSFSRSFSFFKKMDTFSKNVIFYRDVSIWGKLILVGESKNLQKSLQNPDVP